jgi:type IV secretion system protein VirB10
MTDSHAIDREERGTPIDRIEGGMQASAREIRGIAPTTVLIGAVVVILFGLFLGWYLFHGRQPVGKSQNTTAPGTATAMPQRDAITQEQARQALLGTTEPATPAGGTAPSGTPGTVTPPIEPGGAPNAQSGPSAQKVDPRVALEFASRRSPIMGFTGAANPFGQAARAQPAASTQASLDADPAALQDRGGDPARPVAAPAGPTAGAGQDGLSSQLGHHVIETARATMVPDRSFLLSAGTLVPCTLQTAINSTQAGYVSCVIGHDVFSEDGRVVLLDKGTKILGQYSGGIAQGQARLFVLWTRALTPRGVAIDLGSPAADDLGRAGVPGGVDTMFWQRFGGALMLSVLEDLGNVAASHFANAGTQTTQVPASTAGVALQNTINIRPILKKNQGDQVAIFVAKDFDFSDVYAVGVKR